MPDPHAGYDPQAVETKWQARWEERGTHRVDLAGARRPFFNLMMFPYPSAEGLHVGNLYAFTGADIFGRFQRLRGHDVFEPLGFDAFGIHSENYALKVGIHPAELIPRNIATFRRQLRRAGLMHVERHGRKIDCWASQETLQRLASFLGAWARPSRATGCGATVPHRVSLRGGGR